MIFCKWHFHTTCSTVRRWRRASEPQCRVLWHITLHVDRQDFMYVTRQTYSHSHTHTGINICMCVCACILWCRCRFRLAQRNLFLSAIVERGMTREGRRKGEGGGRQSGTDRRSQSQPRRSRVEPIRTSGHCQPSPPKERALYLTLSLSLTVSRSLFPLYGSMCGH